MNVSAIGSMPPVECDGSNAASVKVAAKALDQVEREGQAAVAMIEGASLPPATPMRGSLVNVRA